MNPKRLIFIAIAGTATLVLNSCELMEAEERPIRPTSDNSDIAHGSSSPTSEGGISGMGGLSR